MFLSHDEIALLLGQVLIDVEYEEDGVCDCGPEYTLHFANGQEITVYNHPETGLTLEVD